MMLNGNALWLVVLFLTQSSHAGCLFTGRATSAFSVYRDVQDNPRPRKLKLTSPLKYRWFYRCVWRGSCS